LPETSFYSFQTPRKFNQAEELSETKDKKLSDSNRLKGVFWPGMDLFDSATPEMKRKRNQRKDGSVLAGMIATSRGTEPTEIVYSMDVEYAYTRDIFGPLSAENSPVSPIGCPPPLIQHLTGCRTKPKYRLSRYESHVRLLEL
jgi:hypothetical protein